MFVTPENEKSVSKSRLIILVPKSEQNVSVIKYSQGVDTEVYRK